MCPSLGRLPCRRQWRRRPFPYSSTPGAQGLSYLGSLLAWGERTAPPLPRCCHFVAAFRLTPNMCSCGCDFCGSLRPRWCYPIQGGARSACAMTAARRSRLMTARRCSTGPCSSRSRAPTPLRAAVPRAGEAAPRGVLGAARWPARSARVALAVALPLFAPRGNEHQPGFRQRVRSELRSARVRPERRCRVRGRYLERAW
jgi:hypothetical protein